MIEFWLILGINVAGLAFALVLARWLSARDAGTAELRRLGAAVERASKAFLFSEYRVVATLTAAAVVASAAAAAVAAKTGVAAPRLGAWTAFGVVLGAVSCAVVVHLGVELALRASLRALAGSRVSLDRALALAIRSGGALSLLAETAAALGVFGLFTLRWAVHGSVAPGDVQQLLPSLAALLSGFGVGAVAAGLALQRGGGTYHVASDLAADLAGERDAALEHDDARNPAVISDLVGDHVGSVTTRLVDHFITAVVANLAALLLGATLFELNRASFGSAAALFTLPLVVRSFGVIACAFAIMGVRSTETDPLAALWRGQAATAVVNLGALAGVTFWLLGEGFVLRLVGCGALGILALSAAGHLAQRYTERRLGPLRDALDALRVGEATTVAHGVGVGLQAVLLAVSVAGPALAGAWILGSETGLARGGLLGVLLALMTALGVYPYIATIGALGPIADSACGMGNITLRGSDPDAARRVAKLDDAGFVSSAVAQPYAILASGIAALLAGLSLPALSIGLATTLRPQLYGPVVLLCGALGAGAVLTYAGTVVRSSVRAARTVTGEVERQLRVFPRERGLPQVPRDFTPSYRACIDLTSRAALERLLVTVLLVIGAPVVLGVALRVLYRSARAAAATEALTAFVVAAAVTGACAALAVEGARVTLAAARRASPSREGSAGFRASVSVDAVADLLGNSAAPAAHLSIKATAVVALAIAPFLT